MSAEEVCLREHATLTVVGILAGAAEAATVKDAQKGGVVRRIIGVAVTTEHLVFRREVVVQTDIVLSRIVRHRRRGRGVVIERLVWIRRIGEWIEAQHLQRNCILLARADNVTNTVACQITRIGTRVCRTANRTGCRTARLI